MTGVPYMLSDVTANATALAVSDELLIRLGVWLALGCVVGLCLSFFMRGLRVGSSLAVGAMCGVLAAAGFMLAVQRVGEIAGHGVAAGLLGLGMVLMVARARAHAPKKDVDKAATSHATRHADPTKADPFADQGPDLKAAPKRDPKPDPKPDPKADHKPDPELDPDPAPMAGAQEKQDPAPAAETEPDESEPAPKPERSAPAPKGQAAPKAMKMPGTMQPPLKAKAKPKQPAQSGPSGPSGQPGQSGGSGQPSWMQRP